MIESVNLDDEFPDTLETYAKEFQMLAKYAKLSAKAMRFREKGDIGRASVLEAEKEVLYAKLPDHLRWLLVGFYNIAPILLANQVIGACGVGECQGGTLPEDSCLRSWLDS